MRKTVAFLQLNLIMGKNFKLKGLINFVKSLASNIIFQHLELHKKME